MDKPCNLHLYTNISCGNKLKKLKTKCRDEVLRNRLKLYLLPNWCLCVWWFAPQGSDVEPSHLLGCHDIYYPRSLDMSLNLLTCPIIVQEPSTPLAYFVACWNHSNYGYARFSWHEVFTINQWIFFFLRLFHMSSVGIFGKLWGMRTIVCLSSLIFSPIIGWQSNVCNRPRLVFAQVSTSSTLDRISHESCPIFSSFSSKVCFSYYWKACPCQFYWGHLLLNFSKHHYGLHWVWFHEDPTLLLHGLLTMGEWVLILPSFVLLRALLASLNFCNILVTLELVMVLYMKNVLSLITSLYTQFYLA